MKKKILIILSIIVILLVLIIVFLYFYRDNYVFEKADLNPLEEDTKENSNSSDFKIDEVYHSPNDGDIHYSVYIPSDYDSSKPYNLYITLPGYEGLYFQGVGKNLELEDFAYEARNIDDQLIILAPQLNDWGEESANQTIALIEYYKENYNINKVYANGYSGGGETMSLVMGKRADLIDAYLQVSSKWDGDFDMTVYYQVPVYFVIGRNDEYYGSDPTIRAYNSLYSLYQEKGLSKEEINKILILDIKDTEYFTSKGVDNEHGGGSLIAHDEDIMTWLLTR